MKFLTISSILFLISQIGFSQKKISGDFTTKLSHKKIVSLAVYDLRQGDLVSFEDVCKALEVQFVLSRNQASIKVGKTVLSFLENNSFGLVTSTKGNRKFVYQFYEKPYFIKKMVLLHPREIKRVFNSVFESESSYQQDLELLKINASKSYSNKKQKGNLKNEIFDYKIDRKSNGAILDIVFVNDLPKYEYITANLGSNAYLTLVDTKVNVEKLSRDFSRDDPILFIKAMQLNERSAQLTIRFNSRNYNILSSEVIQHNKKTLRIILRLKADVADAFQKEEQNRVLLEAKKKWELDVITIDPGHGGQDPGAVNKKGLKEKDITLSVARKLGDLIHKNFPEMKVIYTREDDKFVELDRRGKIANQNQSKLFVSLHCNASRNVKAEGLEIYLLGLHKTEAALAIAERENAVIFTESNYKQRYRNFTEENLVMLAMAHNAFLKQSHVLAEMASTTIINATNQYDRGVKQAGFMVLWTPSMPSILVEMGFITNNKESTFLDSDKGQTKIAKSIYEAIVKYKEKYEGL